MWPFDWFASKRMAALSDRQVQQRYVLAGGRFGAAVSVLYLGECIGFRKLHAEWARWEKEYARRGYRALSVDAFTNFGGWCKPLEGLGIKRGADEKALLHAEIYRGLFLGKLKPVIDIALAEPQCGEYALPSTEQPRPEPPPYR